MYYEQFVVDFSLSWCISSCVLTIQISSEDFIVNIKIFVVLLNLILSFPIHASSLNTFFAVEIQNCGKAYFAHQNCNLQYDFSDIYSLIRNEAGQDIYST